MDKIISVELAPGLTAIIPYHEVNIDLKNLFKYIRTYNNFDINLRDTLFI
jgi:hypothetical protein